jgi:hypothetical protein
MILLIREVKANSRCGDSTPVHTSDIHIVTMVIFISGIIYYGRSWFSFLELSTILVFLTPVLIILLLKIYHRHSVAGFRWIVPVLLLSCFSFMAQKSNQDPKDGDKITFTEVGITGLIGKYSQKFQEVNADYDYCGGTSYHYTTLGRQSVPCYQAGMDISYNIWKGKYTKYAFGGKFFWGDENPVQTDYSPESGAAFGISPYTSFNWHWFGFTAGFSAGQLKIPFNKPENKLSDGDIISDGYSRVAFCPALAIRVGSEDIFYGEASFPGMFPYAGLSEIRVGVGSGFGRTNGTTAAIGITDFGAYLRVVYPIRNKLVLEGFYADNFSSGLNATRFLSFGVHYRIY